MSKLLTCMIIVMMPILLFSFMGYTDVGTITGWVMESFQNPQNIQNSPIYLALLLISGIGVGGIIIGALARVEPQTILFITVKVTLGLIFIVAIHDITRIFILLNNINTMLATIVTSPLYIAWIMGLVDWLGGTG